MIVPRHRRKLYGLGNRSDIDVGTASCHKIGRLRREGHKLSVAVNRWSIAGPISLHHRSRIISGNKTRCGTIPVVQVNLLTAHSGLQIGRERCKRHIPPIAADGRGAASLVSSIGGPTIIS